MFADTHGAGECGRTAPDSSGILPHSSPSHVSASINFEETERRVSMFLPFPDGFPAKERTSRMKRFALCAALALFAAPVGAQVYQSAPTDDVWVYEFAGDQTTDGFLRTWGDGVSPLAPSYPQGSNWSHSYLKWNVASIGSGNYRVTEAKLLVTQQVSPTQPGYTLAQGNVNPLEARQVGTNFEEDTWTFGDPGNPIPGATRFGTGDLSNYVPKGTAGVSGFQIALNLLAEGDFSTYFNSAVNGSGELGLALTSLINPAGPTGATYRTFSKDSPTGLGPQLVLRYQAVPEPSGIAFIAVGGLSALACLRRRRAGKRGA